MELKLVNVKNKQKVQHMVFIACCPFLYKDFIFHTNDFSGGRTAARLFYDDLIPG